MAMKYLRHQHLSYHALLECGHHMIVVTSASFLILKDFLGCLEIKTKEPGSYSKYWLYQMLLYSELGPNAFILIFLPFSAMLLRLILSIFQRSYKPQLRGSIWMYHCVLLGLPSLSFMRPNTQIFLVSLMNRLCWQVCYWSIYLLVWGIYIILSCIQPFIYPSIPHLSIHPSYLASIHIFVHSAIHGLK